MEIKAVFVIETEEDRDPVEKMEDVIYTIFSNGESIVDYAGLYKRENDKEEWRRV